MVEKRFQIRQCSNSHCRFRFPASIEQVLSPFCPKCGYKLVNSGLPFSNYLMPALDFGNKMIDISVMLDNVRSALNVGSILRTCECVGVKHAYLCGITPTPDNPKVCKTALNVEKLISWSYHLNTLDTVKNLKQHGSLIWSLEITQHATPITEVIKHQIDSPIVLVAGNEQAGVDPEILVISDKTIFLPMVGKKHSLNISVALGTAITMLISSSWE